MLNVKDVMNNLVKLNMFLIVELLNFENVDGFVIK